MVRLVEGNGLEWAKRFTLLKWLVLVPTAICAVGLGGRCHLPAQEQAPEKTTPPAVSFYRDIRPVFQTHCQGCHQPARQGGEFVMTGHEHLLRAGESGQAAVVPGKPDESYLWQQIAPADGKAEMPKGKPPLREADLRLIKQWIVEGAADDTPMSARPQYDMQHPPVYVAPPVVTSLDFSPDGQLLAVSGYHEVLLHRADGSGLAARLVGLSERIESAVFSPDGKRIAVAGGSPGRMGEIQIWDVAARELITSVPVGYDTCYGASWSGDGKLVAFGCPDNSIRAIESETGRQVLFSGAHNDWVLDTVFSVKSDHVISASRDRSVKLVEVQTQRFVDNITSITPGALKGGLNTIDRHPSQDQLLVGGADGTPKIYKMVREQARQIGDDFNLIRAFAPMPGRVFAVAFNHDGSQIVAGSSYNNTGEVWVYNAADGAVVWRHHVDNGGIYAVDFRADSKVVAAGGLSGQVLLLDAASGQVVQQFEPAPIQGPAIQGPAAASTE